MSSRTLFALGTLFLALAGAGAQVAFAQTQPQPARLQAAGSEIVFTTRQMGVPVEGRFGKFSAQVALDPRKPETGRVGKAARSAELDAEVPKPIWLHAAGFPQATFQSSRIQAAGPGRFEVAGQLTIKGATRDLVVPVQLAPAGNNQVATGSFAIKRLDFKVGEAEWADTSLLANVVIVRFKLVLAGLPPA